MSFAAELEALLPADLPNRATCIAGAARHLDLIVETNQHFNLTRIVSLREAAIKHVLDSVLPWRLFVNANIIVDAGSGAGFPGIPLALVFPQCRFTLVESTQKKARFIECAAAALQLANVQVAPVRVEDWLKLHPAEIVTARAMAPLERAIPLLAPAIRKGARALLYKGRDAAQEIAAASAQSTRAKCRASIVLEYELPDAMGTRAMVEIARA